MSEAEHTLREVSITSSQHLLPRFSTIRTITALCLRELTTSNGDMAGGFMWSVLSPVVTIAALVALFSAGFRTPPLGDNFAIFYASGLLPFSMFRQVSARIDGSIRQARGLLNFPRVTLFDVLVARLIMTIITQAAVAAAVLTFILTVYDTDTQFRIVTLLQSFGVAAFLGCGSGLINCAIKAKFPLWDFIWSFISRPLMLISGIIILVETLPSPYSDWLMWNPLVHITGRMREAFYVDYIGNYADLSYPMSIGLVLIFLGLAGIRIFTRELLDQ